MLSAEGTLTANERLRAGVQLMWDGETQRGAVEVSRASVQLALHETHDLAAASAPLEQALSLFKAARRPPDELIGLYGCLCIASYYVDRRAAVNYEREALACFRRVMKLDLARKLQRVLGDRLGLRLAQLVAAASWRAKAPTAPSFQEVAALSLSALAALTGVSAICIDTARARALAELLEPLAARGYDHVGGVVQRFCRALALTVSDRPGAAAQLWHELLPELQGLRRIRGMTPSLRERLVAGALYACGVLEAWRDSPRALIFAQQLEHVSALPHARSADQLRALYHAHRGEHELSGRYRARIELHARQCGSAWQLETSAPSASISVHLRTGDAPSMQRAITELERLSLELPALCAHATRARAAYYLLRGRPHAAIPLLAEALRATPLSVVGLTRSLGTLAQAYNAIGEHARARQICLSALSQLDAEDLMFCALHLNVQIQAALAQAGLGKLATAARELDALIEKHAAAGGPLTLGALHEARARVAVLAGDERGFSEHLTALESWYLPTGIGSLIALCRRLRAAHAGLPTRTQPARAWE